MSTGGARQRNRMKRIRFTGGYDVSAMAQYPCPFYGTEPHGAEEIMYALRLTGPVPEEAWQALLGDLWGVPGRAFVAPSDQGAWWFEEATEEIGRIDVAVDVEWAIVYQNVGDPMYSMEDIEQYAKAFQTHAVALGVVEIVALFGQLPGYDHETDSWTAWSLEQAMPSKVVTSDERPWSSPWDEYEALLLRES